MKQVTNEKAWLAWFSHQQPLSDTRTSTNRRLMFNFDFLSLNNDIVKIPVGLQVLFFRAHIYGWYPISEVCSGALQSPLVNAIASLRYKLRNMNEAIRTPVTPFSITDILNRQDVPQLSNSSHAAWNHHHGNTHPVGAASPTYLPLPTYYHNTYPIQHLTSYTAHTGSQVPVVMPSLSVERKPEDNTERGNEKAKDHSKLYSKIALESSNLTLEGFLATDFIV